MPKKILSMHAVTPGSIWADMRAYGRTVLVESLDGTHAICTTLTNSHDVQRVIDLPRQMTCSNPRDMRGTTHRIKLDRFRPIHNGFTFVTATGAHLSPRLTAYPAPVQQAIDHGRNFPAVRVCVEDLRGVPGGDTIHLDFLINAPDEFFELNATWATGSGSWAFVGAFARPFSQQDHRIPLNTWGDVCAFLDHHAVSA